MTAPKEDITLPPLPHCHLCLDKRWLPEHQGVPSENCPVCESLESFAFLAIQEDRKRQEGRIAELERGIQQITENWTDAYQAECDAETKLAALEADARKADAIGEAAVTFVNSYQDHIGRCQACDLAWTNLRAAIEATQSHDTIETGKA